MGDGRSFANTLFDMSDIREFELLEPENPEFAFSQWAGKLSPTSGLLTADPGTCIVCGTGKLSCTTHYESRSQDGSTP